MTEPTDEAGGSAAGAGEERNGSTGETSEEPTPAGRPDRMAKLRGIHGFVGVVPLALFVAIHLALQAVALGGPHVFVEVKRAVVETIAWRLFEAFALFLPLAFHVLLGLHRAFSPREHAVPRALGTAGAKTVRWTGLGVLVFLGWHLSGIPFERASGRLALEASYSRMAELYSTTGMLGLPWPALLLLLGVGATVTHLSFGAYNFIAMRRAEGPSRGLGFALGAGAVVLFLLGLGATVHFATGDRFGTEPSWTPPPGACPPG